MQRKDIVRIYMTYLYLIFIYSYGRIVVEINLRLPSMLHGKKGFEKLVWAFKNVLNHTVAWLFYDLASASSGISSGTINLILHPLIRTLKND